MSAHGIQCKQVRYWSHPPRAAVAKKFNFLPVFPKAALGKRKRQKTKSIVKLFALHASAVI